MKWCLFPVCLLILSLCGCKDDAVQNSSAIERISAVGTASFGKNTRHHISAGQDVKIIFEKFLTDNDILELFATPISRTIWKIDLIIPVVPGNNDIIFEAKKLLREHFSLNFGEGNSLDLPDSIINISPAYTHGPRGVRISFTDRSYAALYRDESNSTAAEEQEYSRRIHDDMLIIEAAITDFYRETGSYPHSLSDLSENPGIPRWQGPYLDNIPVDPWNRKYRYQMTDENTFELFCTGCSGKEKQNLIRLLSFHVKRK